MIGVAAVVAVAPAGKSFHLLTSRLMQEPWVTSLNAVSTTQIPVIKMIVAPSHHPGVARTMKIDITFQSQAHRGHGTTQLSVALLSVTPPLAPLVLAIKQLLVEHNLNDPYTGGLSSYGIMLLVMW